VSTIRLRIYNPGLITSIVLFLPFTIFVLALEAQRGTLSGTDIGLIVVAGVRQWAESGLARRPGPVTVISMQHPAYRESPVARPCYNEGMSDIGAVQ